jgi:hypothetical protein
MFLMVIYVIEYGKHETFRRRPSIHTTSVSWATEIIELAAVFFAVGLAHLFVSLVGYHANGAAMLVISGAALLVGAVVHRWWAAHHHADPTTDRRWSRVQDLLSVPASGRDLLRIRTTLPDRPGSLAALCTQRNCRLAAATTRTSVNINRPSPGPGIVRSVWR